MSSGTNHTIKAGLGGLTLISGLLRGRTLAEAQEEARAVLAIAGPIADDLGPKIDAAMARRRGASTARTAHVKCPVQLCVLRAGHQTEANPWCQDQHGTLFQEESSR